MQIFHEMVQHTGNKSGIFTEYYCFPIVVMQKKKLVNINFSIIIMVRVDKMQWWLVILQATSTVSSRVKRGHL